MKFFQQLPCEGPVFTTTVITLSFRVRFGPTSIPNARDERGNLENTFDLCRSPEGPSNLAPRQDFLPLKDKVYHLPLLFRQVYKHIGTPLEGNSRDYGEYKH